MTEADRTITRGTVVSRVSRRTVLRLAAATGALSALNVVAACAPTPAAAPTTAPAKPTAASKAATSVEAAKPADAAKPAAPALATSAPAASTQPDAARRGGTAKVALYSEAPTLDSTWTTAILVVVPSMHVFEYLFHFDGKWESKPALADGIQVGDGGRSYTIPLRRGVTFHNGKEMTAADVIASLNRWGKLSGEGKLAYKVITGITAPDPSTVRIELSAPFAPLTVYLTGPNGGGAIVMPKEIADAAGTDRLGEYVGSGPYRFVEHIPDRHIRVARFDGYTARSEAPDTYAGRRTAYFDEVQFIPVPDAAARIAGVETGNYHWAEEVTRDEYDRLKESRDIDAIVIKPLRFKSIVFNKKQGPMTDVRLRQAALHALDFDEMMAAAFGPTDFWRMDPSLLPVESLWYSEAGKELYNTKDLARARQLVQESGYGGQQIRWIAPADREDYFAVAVTGVRRLKEAGLNAEVVAMDWGSVVKQRTQPDQFDIFNTGHSFSPEPTQVSFLTSDWPGWWENEEKEKQLGALLAEPDTARRKVLWDRFQQLVWDDVPAIKVGEFFGLSLKRKQLKGDSIPISSWPSFWNQWLEK